MTWVVSDPCMYTFSVSTVKKRVCADKIFITNGLSKIKKVGISHCFDLYACDDTIYDPIQKKMLLKTLRIHTDL